MPRAKKKKKAGAAAATRGLDARRLASATPPASVAALARTIEDDGGSALAAYRDPLGGNWQILASLPLSRVEPTPYQRDLSESHVERLAVAIDKLDRYLDPVIAVPAGGGTYWSPNGYHRLGAMKQLGAKSIVAIVVPEPEVAHRILLLNTEKAHNLRERALEVARLAEALSVLDDRPEREFAVEFEEAALVTLGLCYQLNGRFAGGAFHPILKRCDKFLGSKLPKALEIRRERAGKLLELNEAVNAAVAALKERGFQSPYLKAFVVARINPLRFQRKPTADFDETVDKMLASARRFDPARIKVDQVARAGGPPDETG
ncbi:MAG TPA: ParB N-terminal domain-containing protein [Gemmatimonadaceae bacterium]|jgi:ParB family chromosome partitioning protein|nr:ParB N-terminal domain-containing protein [Gemmatimonadaceae bacterium]